MNRRIRTRVGRADRKTEPLLKKPILPECFGKSTAMVEANNKST